ncbi:hypothetical protein PoB_002298400 [Plakobranchus ocellatus]|uniref:Uncharacterized protein n=1 Tax=Plakobranchus ocellatus TaxID=259542 RepID=A0AAV3ZME1_9GAST|nr:hypothetical protein PoB_002298400 [Plakobranchus ocellatus]
MRRKQGLRGENRHLIAVAQITHHVTAQPTRQLAKNVKRKGIGHVYVDRWQRPHSSQNNNPKLTTATPELSLVKETCIKLKQYWRNRCNT